jgi:hypothetical protein
MTKKKTLSKPESTKKRNRRSNKDLSLALLDRVLNALPRMPVKAGDIVDGLKDYRNDLAKKDAAEFASVVGRAKTPLALGLTVTLREKAVKHYPGIDTAKMVLVAQNEKKWLCQLADKTKMIVPSSHLKAL